MNVISLFDGISIGMLALKQLGVSICSYYASEIDPHAITISKKNHPEIIHVGDVRHLRAVDGILYTEDTPLTLPEIDLFIGGSPCQDLTNIGSRDGLRGSKSILFLKYAELLNQVRPRYFMLENVRANPSDVAIISGMTGVDPVEINSRLFCAQQRHRYYWTNIPVAPLPEEDSKEVVRDIVDEQDIDPENSYMTADVPFAEYLLAKGITELVTDMGSVVDVTCKKNTTRANRYRLEHVRALDQKCRCLTTQCGNMATTSGTGLYINGKLRSLSPAEAERLQGLPVGYTEGVPKTHRFKTIGDGWTLNVVAHILKGMES